MICNADLSAGDHLRHCISDNSINFAQKSDESSPGVASCARQQEACHDLMKSSIRTSNKSISQNRKTYSQATSLHNSLVTEKLSTENSTNVSSCSACAAVQNVSEQCGLNKHSILWNVKPSEFAVIYNDSTPTEKLWLENSIDSLDCSTSEEVLDITKRHLSDLEDSLQILVTDLIKERSNNHILKRSFLVAKKVIRNETGQLSTEGVDNLMMKSSEDGWKGQQAIVLALKRKVRTLCTVIGRLETESGQQDRKRSLSQMQSRRSESSKSIAEKGNESCSLELEREGILRDEERYKKSLIASRDSMEDALENQSNRNRELINEIRVLREKLSSTAKNATGDLHDCLRQLQKKLRSCLEEKAEERRNLNSLQEQICHNSRVEWNLKEQIDTERKIVTANKKTLMSLKKNGTSFCMLSLELREIKCKQAFVMRKLDEMLKDYGKIVTRGEVIFSQTVDGRIILRRVNQMQKQIAINKDDSKKYRTLKTITEDKSIMPTVHLKKMATAKTINVCKIKLAKYQEKFKHFESQNLAKLKGLQETICKTKEDLSIVLRNRDSLLKLESDIKVLKIRKKKISKVVSQLPKRKLVMKKNSCPQLTEILDAGRMHSNILTLESKFLKTLIKRIFSSKMDDQELLASFFKRNKDVLLKCS